jgi:hypothetical protein
VPELRTETLSCCSQPRRTLRVFYGTRRASPARRELIRNPRREHNGIGIIEKPAEARRRSSVLARVQRSRALPQLIGAWSRHSLDAADHLLLTAVEGGCLRPGSAALAQVAGTESPIGNLGCPFFSFVVHAANLLFAESKQQGGEAGYGRDRVDRHVKHGGSMLTPAGTGGSDEPSRASWRPNLGVGLHTGVATVEAIGRSQVAGCCLDACIGLPCQAGRSVPGRGGSGVAVVRDRTGLEPAGTRWVHAEPAGRGLQGARAVSRGAEEWQVRQPAQLPPGAIAGDGPEFESPDPAGLRRSLVMSGSSRARLRSCVAASGACSPSRWRSSMWWSGGRGARVPSGGDRASQGRAAGAG